MKFYLKLFLLLIVSCGLATANAAHPKRPMQKNPAPNYNGWHIPFYIGGEVGWAYAHNSLESLESYHYNDASFSHNDVTAGIFIGHEFTSLIAAELGYQYFRGSRLNASGTSSVGTPFSVSEHAALNSIQFLARIKYPLYRHLDALLKVGGAYLHQPAVTGNTLIIDKAKDSLEPIISAGAQYRVNSYWALDVLYTHIFGAQTADDTPPYDAVTGGFTLYYQ